MEGQKRRGAIKKKIGSREIYWNKLEADFL